MGRIDKLAIFRYCIAGGFLILQASCVMPLIKALGYGISIFDFIGLSAKVKEFISAYGEYAEFIANQIEPYRFLCITLVVLPVAAAIAVFFIKTKRVFIVIVSAVIVDNVLGFVFIDQLAVFLQYVNQSFIGLFMEESLHYEKKPIIIWLLIHGVILAAVIGFWIMSLRASSKEKQTFDISHVILDKMKEKRSVTGRYADIPRERRAIEAINEESGVRSKMDDFNGAIICEKGSYAEKVFVMKKGERVSFGSDDAADVFIIGAIDKRSCCLISYDDDICEYIVQPLHPRTVFMESGQPLGANRRYCIPRGMVITIDSGKNSFKLG